MYFGDLPPFSRNRLGCGLRVADPLRREAHLAKNLLRLCRGSDAGFPGLVSFASRLGDGHFPLPCDRRLFRGDVFFSFLRSFFRPRYPEEEWERNEENDLCRHPAQSPRGDGGRSCIGGSVEC